LRFNVLVELVCSELSAASKPANRQEREDKALLEQTLSALASSNGEPVNGIPGYSALWITSLASLYDRSGDLDFLRSQHDALLRVLAAMDASLDRSGAFTNRKGQWLFVD
jgi:alpha-L-rhamnosidase